MDELLAISLDFPNVLYCIDNETNESPEWGKYWAEYVKEKARAKGVEVQVTEMWNAHNVLADEHRATIDNPDLYTFVELSQNNQQVGMSHWSNAQEVRARIIASGRIRPLNSVKIYGANTGRYGTTRDAQERMWRNVLGGFAASRFHRPPSGLGLNEIAQVHLRALRMATGAIDIFSCSPHQGLLSDLSKNEAYCTANPGVEYLVFFPDGGNVLLDVSAAGERELAVRWLDIRRASWHGSPEPARPEGGKLRLITPTEEGYWAVVVKVAS